MSKNHFAAVIVGATVLLGFLAYANTFAGDWVWDDVSSVLLHENVHQPGQFFQLFQEDQHAFGRGQGNFYRPLVSVSFMVDFWLSYSPTLDGSEVKGYPDVKPFIFHLSNLLWHLAAAVLLFFLLVRLQAPRMIQAVAPMLYVLHPMHTEAVAYISGRADMMSATFILAALLSATIPAGSKSRYLGIVASGIFFILGLCSKESTMIYPVLLALVITLTPREDGTAATRADWKSRSLPLAVAVALLVAYGALRATVLKFSEGGASNGTGLGQRLIETCQAFAFYIKTLFIPSGLHMEQTLTGVPVWTAALGFLALAFVLVLIVISYRKQHYRIALGLAWFLAAWLPISGIFPLNAPMAEHWMYVPMAGFWWAILELLLLLSKTAKLRLLVPVLATVLAVVFLHSTIVRNQDWQSNEAIFRATLAENPDTIRVHTNLATTYDYLEGNLAGARRHYEAVVKRYSTSDEGMLPEEIPIRLSLAEVLLRQGEYQEAIRHFGRLTGIAADPNYKGEVARAALGLGECYLALGDYGRASQAFQQANTLDPAISSRSSAILRGEPLPYGGRQ